jgi:hypothetical protein
MLRDHDVSKFSARAMRAGGARVVEEHAASSRLNDQAIVAAHQAENDRRRRWPDEWAIRREQEKRIEAALTRRRQVANAHSGSSPRVRSPRH